MFHKPHQTKIYTLVVKLTISLCKNSMRNLIEKLPP